MSEIDQGWMDQLSAWARDTHLTVTKMDYDLSRMDRRVEKIVEDVSRTDRRVEKIEEGVGKIGDRLKDFEVYEKMAKWAVPLLLVASVTVAWSALELKGLVNRHSEQISTLERATENLSKSISNLERSINRLSDYPKRVERLENRLLRLEPEKPDEVPKLK